MDTFSKRRVKIATFQRPANGCLKRSAKGCQFANNLACKRQSLPFRAIKIDISRLLAQKIVRNGRK